MGIFGRQKDGFEKQKKWFESGLETEISGLRNYLRWGDLPSRRGQAVRAGGIRHENGHADAYAIGLLREHRHISGRS